MARRLNNISEIGMGPEPICTDINSASSDYDNMLGKALNWYNYTHDEKKAREYIVAHFNKIKNKKAASLVKRAGRVITTHGWIARMIDRGAELNTEHYAKLLMFVDQLANAEKAKPEVKEVAPAPKVKRKPDAPPYMGEVDGAIDDLLVDKPFNLVKFFAAYDVPPRGKKAVIELLEKYIAEFEAVREDPELAEGFNRPVRLRRVIKTLREEITKAEKAKPPRVVSARPKKAPSLEAVKYQDKYEDIESVKPVKILGARKVWTFNTKYKELNVLISAVEMTINGTTIKGFEEDVSYRVTLRKPEEVLPRLLKKDDKVLKDVKTKRFAATGRLNEHTIILRVE